MFFKLNISSFSNQLSQGGAETGTPVGTMVIHRAGPHGAGARGGAGCLGEGLPIG